jgi:acetyl esterase/lipase
MKSRHLVDLELVPSSGVFPSFDFRAETLPALRLQMQKSAIAALPPENPAISVETLHVPGPDGAPDVRVVAYRPVGVEGPLPVLLHFHGGGYVVGSPERKGGAHRALALDLSCAIYSVDYRLAPETPFPGAVEDGYAVLRWLTDRSIELGIDRSRIAVSGESAGGGLAASLAVLVRDRGELSLAFQQLISPMLDDRTSAKANANPYAGEFAWTRVDDAFGWSALLGPVVGGDDVSPYAAAARADDLSRLPPAFISVAPLDLLMEEELTYATRLIRAGVPTELHVYPGTYHGSAPMVPKAGVSVAADHDAREALRRAFHGRST